MDTTGLPGAEWIERGVVDLTNGSTTIASLLVSIGSPRLRALGLDFPSPISDAEKRLYLLLAAEDENSAHSRYNALVRTLVSFERAAECVR